MLPPISVIMVAAFAHFSQENAMESAVSSYVQDLAESMAYRLGREPIFWNLPGNLFLDISRYRLFSWGPSIPGWVAYIDNDGKVIMASSGSSNIAAIWKMNPPVGRAVRVKDVNGSQYTLAVYPVDNDRGYVVAAASWDQLLGKVVRVGRLWPILIVFMALCSFASIRLLWRRLIAPLKGLVAEIDDLREGKNLPLPIDPKAVREIVSVHNALVRFSTAAAARENSRNDYVRDIVHVQEKERLDMAREIHDGPLQDITALLQQIHMALEEGEDSKTRIEKTERLAKSVVHELRGLCDELAPPWVELGPSEALTELAERLSQNYDVHVSLDTDDDIDLGSEQTLSLMRIFQEAVSNAVRHGGASEVHARFCREGNDLVFEISDNGKGFNAVVDYEALRLKGHRGLANMTERMALMDGILEVRSLVGKGTSVRCVFSSKQAE